MTDNNEKIQKIAIMVDFYSDRADAHATLFLAFLFGLFTVLAIAQNQNTCKWIWGIPYWFLFLGGFYSFLNFSLYATYAQKITEETHCYEVKEVKTVLDRVNNNPILGRFHLYKHWMGERKIFFKILTGAYFIVAFLSCLLVIGRNEAIFGCIVVSVAILVVYLLARKESKEKNEHIITLSSFFLLSFF